MNYTDSGVLKSPCVPGEAGIPLVLNVLTFQGIIGFSLPVFVEDFCVCFHDGYYLSFSFLIIASQLLLSELCWLRKVHWNGDLLLYFVKESV